MIGAGRDRRKVGLTFVVAATFVARLPYFGNDEVKTGVRAALLKDSYGLICLALLVYLARGIGTRTPEPVSA